ncbi:MAG TPA: tryptophan--tRNA ligase [Polyangiaceae bacterium]|nr:tryptophan--tRNA ligase [Polyangiaceae bacterium]
MNRIFSGAQPSGGLHIGNYYGAIKQWVALAQEPDNETIFCVVDAHAITVEYDPRELPTRVFEAAAAYLAGGIDPSRSIVFVQSDVKEHMELSWYLTSLTMMGELNRMTQFKEKSEQHQDNNNAGIFTYPILMAADVLLYKATLIPVGEDQVQHLELARDICRRFNHRFGRLFPEPKPRLSAAPRIMGLDGKHKMSKSRAANAINLEDPPKVIEKKLKGAFTDPEKLTLGAPGRPEICNIFTIHKAASAPEAVAEIDRDCRSGALPCGECKMRLRDAVVKDLAPLQERYVELRKNPRQVTDMLRDGADKARKIAQSTMTEVYGAMGLTSASQKASS